MEEIKFTDEVVAKNAITDEEYIKILAHCTGLQACHKCDYNDGCPIDNEKTVAVIYRLQSENELLKSEITKECQEHLAFAELAKKADEQQKEEIMQLASENDYLKSERDNLERTLEETGEELKESKAEIERLTAEITEMKSYYSIKGKSIFDVIHEKEQQAVKDTAKEILQELYETPHEYHEKKILEIAKRKGVEVE